MKKPQKSIKAGLTQGTIYKSDSLGRRLMIVLAGSSGKINADGDYHKNIGATIFERWFSKVLDTLTEPSVIVMDNASYHSRCTEDYLTSKWTKPRL